MKSTEQFKKTIKAYLDKRASGDELFAPKYANEKKNIDDCITYILNTVQKSGCNGFHDDEIYGMAVHYYDEESIDVGKEIQARVAVNHVIELTEEEKAKARQKAMEQLQAEAYQTMTKKKEKKAEKQADSVKQASLF
ncbi:MAG: PcfK-like protein [Porphyromonadaceae bacterium]|jgi:hypothetical protein|nr:PcfK-like protein [Porphyromonadaceae bacterium]